MGEIEKEIFTQVINKTDSVLVLYFILVILFITIAFIPLYKLVIKGRTNLANSENDKLDKNIKRESLIIEVVTKNTEVISELKTLFENSLDPSIKELEANTKDIAKKFDDISEFITNNK